MLTCARVCVCVGAHMLVHVLLEEGWGTSTTPNMHLCFLHLMCMPTTRARVTSLSIYAPIACASARHALFLSTKTDEIIPHLHTSHAFLRLMMFRKHSKSRDHLDTLNQQLYTPSIRHKTLTSTITLCTPQLALIFHVACDPFTTVYNSL